MNSRRKMWFQYLLKNHHLNLTDEQVESIYATLMASLERLDDGSPVEKAMHLINDLKLPVMQKETVRKIFKKMINFVAMQEVIEYRASR